MRTKLPLIALCCALLSACGIKGPLYLPPPPGAPAASSAGADHNKPIVPPDLDSDSLLQ
ncbi:MAG: lipoprotein [Thauera sp.]|jgi:predicted small lipoprotein YifL